MAFDARGAVPLAARSRYHGMVSLEKMLIIVLGARWSRLMIPLSVKNPTYAWSEVRGVSE